MEGLGRLGQPAGRNPFRPPPVHSASFNRLATCRRGSGAGSFSSFACPFPFGTTSGSGKSSRPQPSDRPTDFGRRYGASTMWRESGSELLQPLVLRCVCSDAPAPDVQGRKSAELQGESVLRAGHPPRGTRREEECAGEPRKDFSPLAQHGEPPSSLRDTWPCLRSSVLARAHLSTPGDVLARSSNTSPSTTELR